MVELVNEFGVSEEDLAVVVLERLFPADLGLDLALRFLGALFAAAAASFFK